MSLRDFRRHVGRLAVVGFTGLSVPKGLEQLIAEFDLGGVVYFARNAESPAQVRELSREVAALARDWPFWISVDQEGGRVARFRGAFTAWPPAATLGRSGDEALARRFAAALATELSAVGINLDFAPVLDVFTNPANTVIGDRALGTSADDVARLGVAVIEALEGAGVTACGKHFPGHGDTHVDSHEARPIVEHDRRRLDAVEFVPFKRAIARGVSALMTAHVLVPALDEDRVATCSPIVVRDLLKGTLAFPGVVFSDDLGMKGVGAPLAEASLMAVTAGCDVVLLCNSTVDEQVEALETLIRAAESGALPSTRIDDAFRRQHHVKQRLARPSAALSASLDTVGCVAHQLIASEMNAWR